MKKILKHILTVILLLASTAMIFSCNSGGEHGGSGDNNHQCVIPELVEGENGNWWLGDEDTGIPVESDSIEITDTKSEIVVISGEDYCKVTITLSDGTVKEALVKLPAQSSKPEEDGNGEENKGESEGGNVNFVTAASITNGYGGTNGIVCLMTDNDNGKFETLKLLDELYVEYGLVAGLGTVVKNLYTDSSYTSPKLGVIAKVQDFLDTGRWKIVNHSMTHTTYCDTVDGVKTVNEEKLHRELVTSLDHLRTLFPDQRVLTYAMTGNESALGSSSDTNNLRARERQVIAENYIGGRFKSTGATAFDQLEWNNLPFTCLSRASLEKILENIDAAAKDGKYYMVFNHYVIEDDRFSTVDESSWTNKSTAIALCERVSQYVKDGSLWNAHFEDAVMYMRERETATLTTAFSEGKISVIITDEMDDDIYNHPLTVKLTVPEDWENVRVVQNGVVSYAEVKETDGVRYVLANVTPDRGEATVESIAASEVPEATIPQIKPTPDITIKNPEVPNSEIPDVYTYENVDGYFGKLINFDNKASSANTISVVEEGENSVLKMEKTKGQSMPSVTIVGKTLAGATTYIAETKIKINRTSTSGEVYINLMDSQGNYAYCAYIKNNADGTHTFVDYRTGSGVRATSEKFGVVGEYVTLKIVYTVINGKSSITVYADETAILTSSNHYTAGVAPIEPELINALHINFGMGYIGDVCLDDTVVKAAE